MTARIDADSPETLASLAEQIAGFGRSYNLNPLVESDRQPDGYRVWLSGTAPAGQKLTYCYVRLYSWSWLRVVWQDQVRGGNTRMYTFCNPSDCVAYLVRTFVNGDAEAQNGLAISPGEAVAWLKDNPPVATPRPLTAVATAEAVDSSGDFAAGLAAFAALPDATNCPDEDVEVIDHGPVPLVRGLDRVPNPRPGRRFRPGKN